MDLANALREERKSAELQHLDKDFYQQVGVYLAGLGQELSRVEDSVQRRGSDSPGHPQEREE